ncbi:actin-like ATPase domain-containing protein [Cucurbitaria berberidis CBS 394.84]|uniref:Actin-like ATPase domain-containing protein n=1 Tax=Cucurbitaria berberidis CBS 394.84 TaxID=1168544 RepID=A0A9P4GHG8_9PLEO|nr:actin-like ATPase domain-containing protein [Cucurbitaria berberidis CBS 394.84]KAF1845397.1 actin-like ATPase domain-containing protein [Cucurbitaria berberidis CBS 394.84]
MKSNRLIVGLDYGTTYTGVSFCETSDTGSHDEHIEVIHDWPSKHTKIGTKEKVPSEVTYQKEGLLWGSLIPSNIPRHMWTKLQLDARQKGAVAKIIREVSTSPQSAQKQPVEIIADFLGQVKAHLIKNLDQKYGKTLWRTLPLTLVVTVPAVWADIAKAHTLEAVRKAGFNELEFPELNNTIMVTEPEAAAIYTIKALRGTTQDTQFKVGDGFIVCDMGGGTVDLISYRVAGLEPTVIEEATIGNGDHCGGSFVDRAFLKWLERRLGTEDFVDIAGCRSEDIPHTSLSKKAAMMLQDFTLEVKSGFSGTETNYLRLPGAIADDDTRGICDGEIKINFEDTIEMFEHPIRRTYELIGEQLQQARHNKKVEIKFVFMVGGFSESPYVYNKIKAFVETNNLQAIKPAYAWSAVARGAAAKGLEGDKTVIQKRKGRRHYGNSCSPIWIPRKHTEAESYIDKHDGEKRASHQMKWLIKKGQDLPTSGPAHAKVDLCADFRPYHKRETHLTLWASDADRAPKRSTNKDVYTVATVKVDLGAVPQGQFKAKLSVSGALYYRLEYEIHVSVQTSLEYSLVVNGKTYGSLTATYE